MTNSKKIRSQPRIPGTHREYKFTAMHPYVDDGLRLLSQEEHKSVSWIIAEIVGDFFGVNAATGEITSINKYTREFTKQRKRA